MTRLMERETSGDTYTNRDNWWQLIDNHISNDLSTPSSRINYLSKYGPWLCFYQTRSAWSRDQRSNKNHSPAYNFAPTVTKFCVMWEGLCLPHDTKFSNCRCKIVGRRVIFIWSLIPGSSWSGLIKAEPGLSFSNTLKHNKVWDEIIHSFPHFHGCKHWRLGKGE